MITVCLIIKPGFLHSTIIEDVMETFGIRQLLRSNSVFTCLSRKQALFHYAEHIGRPFFDELIDYITSDKVLVIKTEVESVEKARRLTQSIREKYKISITKNVLHCSDSCEAAQRELNNFFN